MEAHTWREKNEDGTWFYQACYHGHKWVMSRALKVGRSEEEIWEEVEPSRELWLKVREVVYNKYQRRRCPWRIIEEIDKILEDDYPEVEEEVDMREDWEKYLDEES